MLTGRAPVVRVFPMIGGIDLAPKVLAGKIRGRLVVEIG